MIEEEFDALRRSAFAIPYQSGVRERARQDSNLRPSVP
jgi:hypothetical protein